MRQLSICKRERGERGRGREGGRERERGRERELLLVAVLIL